MVGGNNLVDRVSKELANKYVNPARVTPRKSGVNFSSVKIGRPPTLAKSSIE